MVIDLNTSHVAARVSSAWWRQTHWTNRIDDQTTDQSFHHCSQPNTTDSLLCRRHTIKKLVVVPETSTCVGQSCTSFFLVGPTSFLHAVEHSSVPTQKLWGTWHEPCNVIGQRVVLVQETVMTCVKFSMQVSSMSFLSVCHRHYSLLQLVLVTSD